ncbi:undecaprenyl-diphosphate phosphatase, partial [bacterium]
MFESILLGLIQGLTEFFPVSSSAHLVMVQSLLPSFPQVDVLFDVMLHMGTILAVLVYFRHEILGFLGSFRPGGSPEKRKVVYMVILATIPTGIMGIAFRDFFHGLFSSPRAAAAFLLVTGAFLWIAESLSKGDTGIEKIGPKKSLALGIAQGIAIAPGISRSGATISAALLMGVRGVDAARFSFFMSIPAVFGAGVGGLKDAGEANLSGSSFALGNLGAFILGPGSYTHLTLPTTRRCEISVGRVRL